MFLCVCVLGLAPLLLRAAAAAAAATGIQRTDVESTCAACKKHPLSRLLCICVLPCNVQVSYLVVYGSLPTSGQLQRWTEAVMRHSGEGEGVGGCPGSLPR